MKTPFKMKAGKEGPMRKNFGSALLKKETTQEERDAMTPAERLLAVVPNKEAYDALSTDTERANFDKAAKEAGLPTIKSKII
jgi:hypothetical protein